MRFVVSVFTTLFLFAVAREGRPADRIEPKTVSSVDLEKYAGTWYEIARYPNRFQRKCISDTRATYSLQPNGKVRVLNQCMEANGKIKTAKGTAKVVDPVSNAKLKVSFFWPFYGDYWILDLDQDYTYAVVGEPKRKYLWILSRTPEIDSNLYAEILERIKEQGYDPTKLIPTKSGKKNND